jgi:LytS/YehU family sensor histidine kinase
MVSKAKDSVVKIDSELLKEVDAYISEEENRFKFVNKKQFIDIAVNDYLRRCKK